MLPARLWWWIMFRDNRLSTTALGEAPKLPASELELLQELQSHKITLVSSVRCNTRELQKRQHRLDQDHQQRSLPAFPGPCSFGTIYTPGIQHNKWLFLSLSWERLATWFQVVSEKQVYSGVNPFFFSEKFIVDAWLFLRKGLLYCPLCKQEKIYVIIFLKNL